MRSCFTIQLFGGRALKGETFLAEQGNQCSAICRKEDLEKGDTGFAQKLRSRLIGIMDEGYYPTDFVSTVVDYDRQKHLFQYRLTYEFTGEKTGDRAWVTLECDALGDRFVLGGDRGTVYGEDCPGNVRRMLEGLFED